jgi:phosphoglycolate phosphatase-like HAD superfamily hydrolase
MATLASSVLPGGLARRTAAGNYREMDAATAGLAGAGIGAAVTLIGTFGASILQNRREREARRHEAEVRRQEAIARLEKERRTEYVSLLVSVREVRYIALRTFQRLATRPVGEVDALLTQLSGAYYRIALIAPDDTRQLAWKLRESAFELWRKARDHPEAGKYQDDMKEIRDLTDQFRSHVADELNLTRTAPSGGQAPSLRPISR